MASVRTYATRNGFDYQVSTDLPDEIKNKFGQKNIRNLSDFWKVGILANREYSLVIDWDVMLSESFNPVLNDAILVNHMGDNFLYNGDDKEMFKIIQDVMISDFKSENIQGQLFHAFCKCVENKKIEINGENILNETGYCHG